MYRAIPFARPVVKGRPIAKTFAYGKRSRGLRMGNVDDPSLGLGFDWSSIGTALKSGVETATQAATQLAPVYMQYRTYRENISRSREGLEPLDAQTMAPSLRVQVQPDPATLRTAGGIGIGVIALGAAALFLLLRRR
jgi:hypothetical protein